MTIQPRDRSVIPETTVLVARAAFPKGNVYMKMRDELGVLYSDSNFVNLFCSDCGQSAMSPGELALVTVMQFGEGLSARQAADEVRSKIDWKYALGLELTNAGFDFSVLSEFRSRLINNGRESQLLNEMLKQFKAKGWLKARGRARTDSTAVLAAIRQLNRLECVGETLHKQLIMSPYDVDARNRTKRDTNWTGYTVHLTETCDQDKPDLITHVETTPATTGDVEMTSMIHQALADQDLLPSEHIVDTAYVDAQHLLSSRTELNIDLLGSVPPDTSWQSQAAQGFGLSCFVIDWEQQQVTCPMGCTSQSWHLRSDNYDNPVLKVRFNPRDCLACPSRNQCTHSPKLPRVLTLKPQALHQALNEARTRQTTESFQQRYAQRAGVEGTLSQGIRADQLRRSRYIGLAKTRLQHLATAAAINLARMWAWWQRIPLASTRVSRFAALAPTTSS